MAFPHHHVPKAQANVEIVSAPGRGFSRPRVTMAAWALFIPLTVLLCYGLWDRQILSQAIWNADGLRRLILLIAAYGTSAIVAFVVRRAWFFPLVAAGGLLYGVAAVGFGPVAAAAFLAVSALLLGDGLLCLLGSRREASRVIDAAILAVLVGAALVCLGVGIAAHFPINYRAVYVGILAAPFAFNGAGWRFYAGRAADSLRAPAALPGAAFWAYSLLGFAVVAHFLVVLKPEVSYDGLAVHLMAPAYVGAHHAWSFDPRQYAWAVMPMGGDWLYTAAYILGGEFAAKLTNFIVLLLVLAILHSLARRWVSRPVAAIGVALFASTPLIQVVTGSLFIENTLAAMILGSVLAVDRLRRSGNSAYLLAAGLLLGTSLSVKLGALSCAIPLACFAAVAAHRRRGWRSVRPWHAWAALAAFLLIGAFPYVYAWRLTGSPVYPFTPGLFVSPFPPKLPPSWDTLYRITFRSHEYMESQEGAAGFHYLLFLPASLILFFSRRIPYAVRVAGVTACVSGVAVLCTQPYLRYWYPAAALFSIVFCALLAAVSRLHVGLFRYVTAIAVLCVLLNIYCLPASGWYQKDFLLPFLFNDSSEQAYLKSMAPARGLIAYLNLKRPGEAAWFIGTNQIAGLIGRAYSAAWHQPSFANEVIALRTPAEVKALAGRHGLRNFIAPVEPSPTIGEPVWAFLQESTVKEYEFGAMGLYRIRDAALYQSDLIGNASRKGWADWQRNGTVTIAAGSGAARVTASDTLVESVPVEPLTTYRYSMEVSCETPGSLFRLQINWHDTAGRFLGTSIDPRPCTAQWTLYSKDMTAPEGAHFGTIIVGGHTAAPVLVRSVSLKY